MAWPHELVKITPFTGEILLNEPLSKHTHFKIGGPAAALAIPKSIDDLGVLRDFSIRHKIQIQFIGLGSNLLINDSGLDSLCIKTTRLPSVIKEESDGIRVGAGVPVATFLRSAASNGWDGFECISGIPGTFGGLVAMNGGTHLGEASNLILEVRTFDFSNSGSPIKIRNLDELSFSYRKNNFLGSDELVIDSLWKMKSGDSAIIREKLDSLYRRRKETQPLEFPSCGSVFRNPTSSTLKAWEVIEKIGLRGYKVGNAQFAEKHPNWILNLGGAKASEVIALIELAKTRARDLLAISLIEEVHIL